MKLATHSRHREHLRAIQWALLERKTNHGEIWFPYSSMPSQVTLHPYRLCLTRQAWYLISARPASHDRPQVYRVARLRGGAPSRSAGGGARRFRPTQLFRQRLVGVSGRRAVRYRTAYFRARRGARIVAETHWHHTQQVRRHTDGSATLTFSVDGLDEILWWLLAWAGCHRGPARQAARDVRRAASRV